ncbi:hypothetical protein SDC9_136179 [bioreactor metagenome]|uniref:Uncharacterized protein n=1 Tax=bioreactor metagenome TaxID=1076179 RepID=A0A645DIK1_9ZZZZ
MANQCVRKLSAAVPVELPEGVQRAVPPACQLEDPFRSCSQGIVGNRRREKPDTLSHTQDPDGPMPEFRQVAQRGADHPFLVRRNAVVKIRAGVVNNRRDSQFPEPGCGIPTDDAVNIPAEQRLDRLLMHLFRIVAAPEGEEALIAAFPDFPLKLQCDVTVEARSGHRHGDADCERLAGTQLPRRLIRAVIQRLDRLLHLPPVFRRALPVTGVVDEIGDQALRQAAMLRHIFNCHLFRLAGHKLNSCCILLRGTFHDINYA